MNLMDENLQKFIRACITCIIAWIALVGCSKDDDFVSTYSERQEKAFALFNGTWADIQFSNLSGGEFCCRLIILATFAIVLHISMAVARTANNPLAVFLYPDGNIYIGIVPPWKSVMEILPLMVKYNGKGNAVFLLPANITPFPSQFSRF